MPGVKRIGERFCSLQVVSTMYRVDSAMRGGE
jgi:hypothetical protein